MTIMVEVVAEEEVVEPTLVVPRMEDILAEALVADLVAVVVLVVALVAVALEVAEPVEAGRIAYLKAGYLSLDTYTN